MSKSKKAPAPKTAKVAGPAQPIAAVVDYIRKGKSVTRESVRKFLEKDYAKATVNAQMSRLKNSRLLKVSEDKVVFVGK